MKTYILIILTGLFCGLGATSTPTTMPTSEPATIRLDLSHDRRVSQMPWAASQRMPWGRHVVGGPVVVDLGGGITIAHVMAAIDLGGDRSRRVDSIGLFYPASNAETSYEDALPVATKFHMNLTALRRFHDQITKGADPGFVGMMTQFPPEAGRNPPVQVQLWVHKDERAAPAARYSVTVLVQWYSESQVEEAKEYVAAASWPTSLPTSGPTTEQAAIRLDFTHGRRADEIPWFTSQHMPWGRHVVNRPVVVVLGGGVTISHFMFAISFGPNRGGMVRGLWLYYPASSEEKAYDDALAIATRFHMDLTSFRDFHEEMVTRGEGDNVSAATPSPPEVGRNPPVEVSVWVDKNERVAPAMRYRVIVLINWYSDHQIEAATKSSR